MCSNVNFTCYHFINYFFAIPISTATSIFRASDVCSGTTIVVKTHLVSDKRVQKCKVQGAIFLIRNPYSAILAEFNRRMSNKTSIADASNFLQGNGKFTCVCVCTRYKRLESWLLLSVLCLSNLLSLCFLVYISDQ